MMMVIMMTVILIMMSMTDGVSVLLCVTVAAVGD